MPRLAQQGQAQEPPTCTTLLSLCMPVFLSRADVRISNLRRGTQVALVHLLGSLMLRVGRRQPALLRHISKPQLQQPLWCELSLSLLLGQPRPDTVVPKWLTDSSVHSRESQEDYNCLPCPFLPPAASALGECLSSV